MKVAAPYTLDNKYNNLIDEYNIIYNDTTANLQKLLDFCEKYKDKRINIQFIKDIEYEYLTVLKKIHDNVVVRLDSHQINELPLLKEKEISFFFDSNLPCYSLSLLDSLIETKVTDIYISDFLCYNMQKVYNICNKNNIQIRLILNKIPQFTPDRGIDIKAPIFNPRDIDELSKYIDVFEFDCGEPYDWHVFNVYYKIWFEKKDWIGDLNEINKDLKIPINIKTIAPNFLNRKFNCGRQCSLGYPCKRCLDWYELSQELYDNNLFIKK